MTTQYLLLVDGNNLAMRIIKALEHSGALMSSGQGSNTGPVHVFAQSMMRYVDGFNPDQVVICFDGPRNARRMALHPGYKASRKKRSPDEEQVHRDRFLLIKEWAELYGAFCIEREDLEADDLIAIYVQDSSPNTQVRIVSADKDLLQLVSSRVEVLSPGQGGKGHDVIWKEDEVMVKMGTLPTGLPFLKALMGDKSDDIDGIPGVGPVKALTICEDSCWDITQILKHPKVAGYENLVERNLQLVDLSIGRDQLAFPIPAPPPFQRLTLASSRWTSMQQFLRRHGLDRVESMMESSMIGWGRAK